MEYDESNPRSLYVGNLDNSVTEELISTLFSQMGPLVSCKVIREPGVDPYAFVEYANHQSAVTALSAMNHRLFLSRELKVNWASSPGNTGPKADTSNHYHIFVGDLSPEIETRTLREAFSAFGEISNCKIVRDAQTLQSKGYAFVSFVNKEDAENAINAMNGQWLGNRSIRTNWSARPPPSRSAGRSAQGGVSKNLTYEDISNQTGPNNCTIYCGGMSTGMTEEVLESKFSQYGAIVDIRVFKDKGYAFIKFSNKDSATRAIQHVNNTQINGQYVKCFWGKENVDKSAAPSGTATATQPYCFDHSVANYHFGSPRSPPFWYGSNNIAQPAGYYHTPHPPPPPVPPFGYPPMGGGFPPPHFPAAGPPPCSEAESWMRDGTR